MKLFTTTLLVTLFFVGIAAAAPLPDPVNRAEAGSTVNPGSTPATVSTALDPVVKTHGWDCVTTVSDDGEGNITETTDCQWTDEGNDPFNDCGDGHCQLSSEPVAHFQVRRSHIAPPGVIE